MVCVSYEEIRGKIGLTSFFCEEDDKWPREKELKFTGKELISYLERFEACGVKITEGYSNFCIHLFVPNFSETKPSYIEIREGIREQIVSDYLARNESELPVLSRWVELSNLERNGITVKPGKYLDIILYDAEQCRKEGEKTKKNSLYNVVAVKCQNENKETPMTPITALRNALGIEEGGSGVSLDKKYYKKCVEFWRKHVMLRS